MSGKEMVPRRSAEREAVGSYTVCLYHPLSWPQMNQGPYFFDSPPPPPRRPPAGFLPSSCARCHSASSSSHGSSSSAGGAAPASMQHSSLLSAVAWLGQQHILALACQPRPLNPPAHFEHV